MHTKKEKMIVKIDVKHTRYRSEAENHDKTQCAEKTPKLPDNKMN